MQEKYGALGYLETVEFRSCEEPCAPATFTPHLSGTLICSRMLCSFTSSVLVRLAAASTSRDISCRSMEPPSVQWRGVNVVILIQTLHVVIHNICVWMIERKKLTQRQQRAELLAVQGVEVKQVSHCVDNFHTCGLEAGEAHMIQ